MTVRLSKVAREFNVGLSTIVEFLQEKGIKISSDPNAKLSEEQYNLVAKEYSKDSEVRKEAKRMDLKTSRQKKETVTIDNINASPEGKKCDTGLPLPSSETCSSPALFIFAEAL